MQNWFVLIQNAFPFRYMEYELIKAKMQQLSSKVKVRGQVKVKVKGRVKVKYQGQGQSEFKAWPWPWPVALKSSTCDLEMNLVMDIKFDLEMT